MPKASSTNTKPARRRTAKAAPPPTAPAQTPPAAPTRPGGKLGLIIDRLGAATGATADELAAATGWQKHTVLGALSRLRTRGFAMNLMTDGNRKAYQLVRAEA